MSKKRLIYLGGIFLLGFFYEPLKRLAPNGLVFIIGGACYLILIQLIAERLDRRK